MNGAQEYDLRLAKGGEVDCANFARLGFERLTWGVYGRSPSTDGLSKYVARRARFMARVAAVVAAYGGTSVALAGPTALQALRVALPTSLEDWERCHLIVPRQTPRPRRAGVIAHRSNDFRVWAHLAGLPLQHPVDAWVQLHGATVGELVEVGDGLVRRKRPLLTVEKIESRLDELRGHPGVRRVRQAMRWVRPGTDSLYETRTRMKMLQAGLAEPTVNLPVYSRAADYWYHVDMGYEAARLAVEYDGEDHGERQQREIDAERRRDLQDEGWTIIIVTAKQLNHPAPFLRSVEQALALRLP